MTAVTRQEQGESGIVAPQEPKIAPKKLPRSAKLQIQRGRDSSAASASLPNFPAMEEDNCLTGMPRFITTPIQDMA